MSYEDKGVVFALGTGWVSFVYASVLRKDSQCEKPLTNLTADFTREWHVDQLDAFSSRALSKQV